MVKVFLVEHNPLFTQGFIDALELDPSLVLAGHAANCRSAMTSIREAQPHVVVIDLGLPVLSGVELSIWLREELPEACPLWISNHVSADYLGLARTLGVRGFVAKIEDAHVFVRAIQTVANGDEYWVRPASEPPLQASQRQESAFRSVPPLSERQRQIIRLIADGLPNKLIADKLHITKRTVDTHRTIIYRKLKLHNTAELTRYCIEHRL